MKFRSIQKIAVAALLAVLAVTLCIQTLIGAPATATATTNEYQIVQTEKYWGPPTAQFPTGWSSVRRPGATQLSITFGLEEDATGQKVHPLSPLKKYRLEYDWHGDITYKLYGPGTPNGPYVSFEGAARTETITIGSGPTYKYLVELPD